MVYGCDPAWWRHRRGLPDFSGLKVAWAGGGLEEYPDLLKAHIPGNRSAGFANAMLFDTVGTIGGGRNSGFQAVNLAAQLGANRILLVGFDMTARSGIHWYGRNTWAGANNPDEAQMAKWIDLFDRAAPELKRRGVEVFNCSSQSALKCFPKVSLEVCLAGF